MSDAQQLTLGACLPPLRLRDRVRVRSEDWIGEVAQVWPGRDWYAVFAWDWRGPIDAVLPVYRRDELELIDARSNTL